MGRHCEATNPQPVIPHIKDKQWQSIDPKGSSRNPRRRARGRWASQPKAPEPASHGGRQRRSRSARKRRAAGKSGHRKVREITRHTGSAMCTEPTINGPLRSALWGAGQIIIRTPAPPCEERVRRMDRESSVPTRLKGHESIPPDLPRNHL